MRSTLRRRFVISVSVSVFIVFLSMALFGQRLLRPVVFASWQDQVIERARYSAALLDAELVLAARTAADAAVVMESIGGEWDEQLDPLLRSSLAGHPWVTSLVAVVGSDTGSEHPRVTAARWDDTGQAVSHGITGEQDLKIWGVLIDAAKELGAPFWGAPGTDELTGTGPVARYVTPLRSAGAVVGALVAQIGLERIQSIAPKQVRHERYSLVTRQGVFLTHRDADLILRSTLMDRARELSSSDLADLAASIRSQPEGMRRLARLGDQPPHWAVFVPMTVSDWVYMVAVPEDEPESRLDAIRRPAALLLTALLVLTLVPVFIASRYLMKPFRRLADAVQEMQCDGDEHVSKPLDGDELTALASGVRELGRRLDQGTMALSRAVAERDSRLERLEQENREHAARLQAAASSLDATREERGSLRRALDRAEQMLREVRVVGKGSDQKLAEVDAIREQLEAQVENSRRLLSAAWPRQPGHGFVLGGTEVVVRFRGSSTGDSLAWLESHRVGEAGGLWVLGRVSLRSVEDGLRAALLRLEIPNLVQKACPVGRLLERLLRCWQEDLHGEGGLDLCLVAEDSRGVQFASVGHPSPLVMEAGGVVRTGKDRGELDPRGWAVGALADGETLVSRTREWVGENGPGHSEDDLSILLETHAALDLEALSALLVEDVTGSPVPRGSEALFLLMHGKRDLDETGKRDAGPLSRLFK